MATKRFSLSNFPGRDDDVDEADVRHERELRRRIRESDPMFAQKRLEAQQQAAKEKRQQQQASRGFVSTTSLPTPEQAVLTREQEARVLSPQGRSQLLLRQNAQNPYLSTPPSNKSGKKSFAKWTEVAQETDAEQAVTNKQHHVLAEVITRNAENSEAISNEIQDLIANGVVSPEAVQSFEDSDINPMNVARKKLNHHNNSEKKTPNFMPEPIITHKFSSRCVDVSRKTASIRYRDICAAKTPDEMGALGIDPELLGNFGGNFGNSNNQMDDDNTPSSLQKYHRERERIAEEQRKLKQIPDMPDAFDGVPVRGDSHSRLLAYRKEKEKDKMASAQRALITQRARERQEKELEKLGVNVGANNGENNNDDDEDAARNRLGAKRAGAPSAEEIMRDCAVYLDDEDESKKHVADPGYPLPMHLGTADRSHQNVNDFSFSGVDPNATDNEDLIILTTSSLRLASKVVLQCVFSIQAADVRENSIPNIPMVQYIPIRQCPFFVQKSHTLMMHEIKRQLRDKKRVSRNTFVIWTRVLLSRTTDPEDDIVAADDCHIEEMAAHDDILPHNNNNRTPSRRRGGAQQLPPTSPGGGSSAFASRSRRKQQHEYAGGTTLEQPDESNALLSGSATVDMMVTSPHSTQKRTKEDIARLVAVSPNDITFAQLQHQLRQEEAQGKSGSKVPLTQQQLDNETAHERLFRHRMSPALPVLVRAPRPILHKPPERSLFVEPAAPTASDIANEFKEFTSAIRPILDQHVDPPGASRFDPDHIPTPPAELIMDDDDDEEEEEYYYEEVEDEGNNSGSNNYYTSSAGEETATSSNASRPKTKRLVKKSRKGRSILGNSNRRGNKNGASDDNDESDEGKNKEQETGADDWKATKQMMSALDMEEIYEPMRNPSNLEISSLIQDKAPFDNYETAAMTARAITIKLREQLTSSSSSLSAAPKLTSSETERLKARLFEALEFIKKQVVEATTKMARADSQVEFRFKMQESIVKRESDGTVFETAAKSVLNADQRINMLNQRVETDLEDIRYTYNRQQNLSFHLAREREERSISSRHPSPQHTNSASPRQQSPQIGRGGHNTSANSTGLQSSPFTNATAFKPAPQPTSLPAQLRRPVQPVALKYAKPGETAPQSVSNFLEHQREGSFERPASSIKPEVHSPERLKIHEPNLSEPTHNDDRVINTAAEEDDDVPVLLED